MEGWQKRLPIKGKTYTLSLIQNLDATWECRIIPETGNEIICKNASAHEVKYLSHVIAYDQAAMRRDRECEEECENGWELQSFGTTSDNTEAKRTKKEKDESGSDGMQWTTFAPGQGPEVLTSISHECADGQCEKCTGLFPRESYPGQSIFCVHECHLAQNHDSYIPVP